MSTFDKKNLLLLFYRPLEPAFLPKGPNDVAFSIPVEYLPEEYSNIDRAEFVAFVNRNVKQTIPVITTTIPSLERALDIPKDDVFSIFNLKHRASAAELVQIFYDAKNLEELLAVAIYASFRVNPYLFAYALSVALLHRPDTKELVLPSPVYYFPDKFIDGKVLSKAALQVSTIPERYRKPIVIPPDYTASDLDIEHRVAYFREDLGVNLHHWQWHAVYPDSGVGLNKDRRGELFYYMHQQMLARYDFERLSNTLNRVERYINWDQPISEAYFPKMTSTVASRQWPARTANEILHNLTREDNQYVDINDLKKWRDRIVDAIDSGFVVDAKGKRIDLTEDKGIDILGNMIEASDLSVHKVFYGNIHNMGHNMISLVHDPDYRNLEPAGVMGTFETSMRDPIFYRWHGYINDLFQEHKLTLPSYEVDQLNYDGITISGIETESVQGNKDTFQTFWAQSTVDIAGGLDFQSCKKLLVTFTHLQHYPFVYKIAVTNNNKESKWGTVRIFLAPKYDERGSKWKFNEQRNAFIEMDKFPVLLQPGANEITRESKDSSVTIPFRQIFRDIHFNDEGKPNPSFCGCGWPEYLLIPKGTAGGMDSELFVMVSNYDNDKVDGATDNPVCKDAYSFCGTKDKLYPDRRAMGYPFDRKAAKSHHTLADFLTPNMKVKNVTVKFEKTAIVPIGSG